MKKLLLLFLLGVSCTHAMEKENYKELLIEISEQVTEALVGTSEVILSETSRWILGEEEYESPPGCTCCDESWEFRLFFEIVLVGLRVLYAR